MYDPSSQSLVLQKSVRFLSIVQYVGKRKRDEPGSIGLLERCDSDCFSSKITKPDKLG